MSLEELVAQAGRALSDARTLFGAAPLDGGLPLAQELVTARQGLADAAGCAAASWEGAGAASYSSANSDQLQALDRTIVSDGQLASALTSTGQTAAAGARSMDNLIAETRSGVAALGSSARSPAGQQELATYLQGQLSKAKGLVQTYTTADSQAAQQYRAIAWPTHLPEIHIDPTPPPPPRPRAPVCYIGTEDGDVAKVCPPDTDTVTYFDKDGIGVCS